MMIFRGVTDIESNNVVEREMLKFQGKEISNDIELISDYENPGYVELYLKQNYSFEFMDAGAGYPPTQMRIGLRGNSQVVDIGVPLEDQNLGSGSQQDFSTDTLCIYEDYPYPAPWNQFSWWSGAGDTYDPEGDGYASDDPHVQVYPGVCRP